MPRYNKTNPHPESSEGILRTIVPVRRTAPRYTLQLTREELSSLITALDGDLESRRKEVDIARGYSPPGTPDNHFVQDCTAAIANVDALQTKLLNLH